MDRGGYGQFCPVAMASEVLCARWTMLVLREMLCGTTRFNDLRRGVPRMSPGLLSKRLKELEASGVVRRVANAGGVDEYHLTAAGEDLRPVITGIGFWGQCWVESQMTLKNLDPSLLMWDMRRRLRPEPLPPQRCAIQFLYPELPEARRHWWLLVERDSVDLCSVDPGVEIDLLVTASLRAMTAVWMGLADLRAEIAAGRVRLEGAPAIASSMRQWLGRSIFAEGARRAS
jgi:DNA-binding HxlR family transcriptional regulator